MKMVNLFKMLFNAVSTFANIVSANMHDEKFSKITIVSGDTEYEIAVFKKEKAEENTNGN